jgi:hypothetical protein
MRIVHPATALAVAAALLVGCGGQETSSSADSAATSSTAGSSPTDRTSPEWSGEVIPDGTYTKTRTAADAKRLGIPKERAVEFIGDDGELHVELRIAGDSWAQFADDDGPMSLGDEGTATYDAKGNWVATSNSSGCPGCVATFEWSLKGDRLMLTLLDTTEAGDPVELLVGRLVTEGIWTRR